MKKLSENKKKNIRNASSFVLGVIITIIITKTSDKIVPNDPVIVKEYTDTIKIVHDYKIPNELNGDSTTQELERKIKNLELLNNYDRQIKERITLTKNVDGVIPNLILTGSENRIKSKGYTYGSSSAYFTSVCPDMNNDFLDIRLDFFNPTFTKDIAYLRVNIYRFDNKNSNEARTSILEEFYEVKSQNNIIRISNDFPKGKYEILYGFIFNNELTKTFPSFNFKKCIVTK
ncbi:hypothetical protein [Parapedobacter sp. DT-150]|uniref:hypothetical protein n=1 Tax=Parapedobacter sp. DT-150 TaxID=3396162 RepID=UPI003F1CD0B7